MKNALKKVGIKNIQYTKIETTYGDIIKINSNGFLSRSEFEDKEDFIYASFMKYYDDFEDDYYIQHEQLLFDICNTFGVSEDDVVLLLDYSYSSDPLYV